MIVAPYVQALARWRAATPERREQLLREQAADNRIVNSYCNAYRGLWRHGMADDGLDQGVIAPNGVPISDTTGAERAEIVAWVTALVEAVRARYAVFELLARATAAGIKI